MARRRDQWRNKRRPSEGQNANDVSFGSRRHKDAVPRGTVFKAVRVKRNGESETSAGLRRGPAEHVSSASIHRLLPTWTEVDKKSHGQSKKHCILIRRTHMHTTPPTASQANRKCISFTSNSMLRTIDCTTPTAVWTSTNKTDSCHGASGSALYHCVLSPCFQLRQACAHETDIYVVLQTHALTLPHASISTRS